MARPDRFQYANASPIYGSAARDLRAMPAPNYEPRYVEPEIELPGIHTQPKVGERAKVRPAVRTKQAVAPMAILGYLVVGVLLMFTLFAQIRLSGISDASAKLQTQLNTLQTERARLLVEYESTFNFTEIENYAVNTLGMQQPQPSQIFYLQADAPDKTVILTPPKDEGSLLNRLSDALSSLGEYLK